jgi:hypothetical protein
MLVKHNQTTVSDDSPVTTNDWPTPSPVGRVFAYVVLAIRKFGIESQQQPLI